MFLLMAACTSSPAGDTWTLPDDVHFATPQEYLGGEVLVQPRLMTVSFASDPERQAQTDFVGFLCHSNWWKAWASGACSTGNPTSCVGLCSGVTAASLELPAAPTYSTSIANALGLDPTPTIDGLLANAFAAHQLPEPTENDLVVLHVPQSSTLLVGGDDPCQNWGDDVTFRSYVQIPRADQTVIEVPYVVSPNCPAGSHADDSPGVHQYALSQRIAFATKWPRNLGAENTTTVSAPYSMSASLCSFLGRGAASATEGGYELARIWNNAASVAGLEPCSPVLEKSPYVQMRAQVDYAHGSYAKNPADRAVHIPLLAVSDQPVPEGWLVSAYEFEDPNFLHDIQFPSAVLRLDGEPTKLVHAGDVVVLKVTVQANALTTQPKFPAYRRIGVYSTRLTTKDTSALFLRVDL